MKNKNIKLLFLAAALLLIGCNSNPTSSSENSEFTSSEVSENTSSEEIQYENQITIAQALEIARQAGSAGTSSKYTVIGTIKVIESTQYGDMIITDGTDELFIYGPRGADGTTYFNKMETIPSTGDTVVLYGKLKDYNGKLEMDHPAIIDMILNGNDSNEEIDDNLPTSGEITLAQAKQIALKTGETLTTGTYIIKGTITSIANSQYGNVYISDGTDEFLVYGLYDNDGNRYDEMTSQPTTGDEIVVEGKLMAFKGNTPQMKDGILKEVKVTFDPTLYSQKTISEARELEKGTLVKVTGVVASITYATGMVPNGFYVVDDGASIYVYGKDVVSGVSVGNMVTVAGTKDYYVLETEINAANEWGYKGSNQLSNARVLSNDKLTTGEWDKSWVNETTVKAIMDTECNIDITTTIYKVTALVTKAVGTGFTNYYINDLDGYTGTYSYSQANGEDYSWLDEFDGKICTVYLSVHNAKSATKGCVWRFVPIACEEDNEFEFDMSTAAKFAYDYYLDGIFEGEYYENKDAKLELIKSIQNDIVNFEAKVTYSSSNTSVAWIENSDSVDKLHINEKGKATITITVEVENQPSYVKEVEIEVKEEPKLETNPISEVIESEDGTEVIVSGVVVASIVNQSGFYIQDETGIITVIGSEDMVSSLSIGDSIIIKGVKGHKMKTGVSLPGQICILDAELISNFHGGNSYSTDKFITGKNLEFLKTLNATNDKHSTEVYIVKATINIIETPYFTSINLIDGNTSFDLYCSGAGQYSFLKAYSGQEVTLEINPCNYNGTYYKGCVLAVIDSNNVKTINQLNFNK